MNLKEFMEETGETPFTIGPKVDVHPMTVYRHLRRLPMSAKVAKRYIDFSEGRITLDDLLGDGRDE